MSQAVIEFCEGLKTTLLGIEDRLDKAKQSLTSGASNLSGEAKHHVEEAAEQLESFKAQAGIMAKTIRAELPEHAAGLKDKLAEFGQEAQVAMRHAVVFLAEAASKGAEGSAEALLAGAKKAHAVAEELRRETAVSIPGPAKPAD